MKNLLKISLLAAAIFATSATYANDEVYTLKVKADDNKSIRFFIDEASDINLSIREVNNEVLFEENIHSTGASTKTYDLNALPNGEYVLNVQSDSKVAEYKIVIADNKAVISKPIIKNVFKPVITKKDSMITLNLDNVDKGDVDVAVYNEYNEELYKETFTNKAIVTKRFDTLKTFGRELTFVVKSATQEVVKTVQIR